MQISYQREYRTTDMAIARRQIDVQGGGQGDVQRVRGSEMRWARSLRYGARMAEVPKDG